MNKKKRIPTYYDYSEHGIKSSKIDSRSFEIAKKIIKSGHQAYVVGGAIRDILLNRTPKDFDLVTDLKPEEIKKLFHNSYIIGRRFKLVHIRSKGSITEVSTFRSQSASIPQIIKGIFNLRSNKYFYQNIYGTIDDDVMRRDITINALYYDPVNGKLIDFTGGFSDLKAKRMNVVGIPAKKFAEDPMRILRMIRFSAKLDFKINDEMAQEIDAMKDHILTLPGSRILEEFNKFFINGHAYKSYRKLVKHDCMKYIISYDWHNISENDQAMMCEALKDTDDRYSRQQYLAVIFLLSLFMWPKYSDEMHKIGKPSSMKFQTLRTNHRKVCELIFREQKETMAIPIKLAIRLEKIWILQYQMESTNKNKKLQRIKENGHFKMAFDLMKIRAIRRPKLKEICNYWQEHAEANAKVIAARRELKKNRRPPKKSNMSKNKQALTY